MRGRSAALLLLALAGACGDRESGAADEAKTRSSEQVERGGTAVLAELSDMSKPMPLIFDSSLDGDLQDVMYMALTRGAWKDGKLVYQTSSDNPMALAWMYELVGPDSASLRYRMRSGVRWSDGQPITAEDVVWTYGVLDDPALASPRQDYLEHIDSVTAENDSTVVFHFDRRYPEMLFHSGLPIAPKHVYENIPPGEIRSSQPLTDPANGNLVVSGAFMVGAWDKGSTITLVPNPYFEPKPNLDAIVIRIIPEETTRLIELQTGNVDFMRPVAFDKVPALKAQNPEIRFATEQKRFFDYIGYNPKEFAPFADAEVRRALGLALDVSGIIAALQMGEYAVPAAGPYAPIFKELYDAERLKPLPHDPARARQILAAKGWRDSDGDGVLDREGKPFRFTLVTNSGNARRADVSQIVQQQWKQVGVDVELQTLETNTFFDRLTKRDFEAALSGWAVALAPDLSPIWAGDSPFNFVSYQNPTVTRLIQRALAQPTAEQAAPTWRAAAERIVADQPYTWLYFFDQVDGVNERLKGMRVDTYGAYQNAWEWWIPKDRQRTRRAPTASNAADTPSAEKRQ